MTGNIINSLSDILEVARQEKMNPHEVWYRGQSNAEYKLIPSLARLSNGFKHEMEVFETYRKFAKKLQPKHHDEWELLIDMQHYFVPTRILDWSESLGIALFFAVTYHQSGQEAGLFVLDPLALNKKSGIYGIPSMPDDPMGLKYIDSFILKKPYEVPNPIAIKSAFINDRVMAQRGMFTVHTDKKEGIDDKHPDIVKKYIIKEKAIPEIKEFLEISNINISTIFPDFYGVADYIKGIYFTDR